MTEPRYAIVCADYRSGPLTKRQAERQIAAITLCRNTHHIELFTNTNGQEPS